MEQNYPVVDAGQNYPSLSGEKKHSRFGIASFIISIICGVLVYVPLFTVAFTQIETGSNESYGYLAIVFGSLCINFIGIGLGIAGLFEKNRKKIFAILGLVFSGLTILGLVCLFAIGMVYGNSAL